jgi:hypothetical protein
MLIRSALFPINCSQKSTERVCTLWNIDSAVKTKQEINKMAVSVKTFYDITDFAKYCHRQGGRIPITLVLLHDTSSYLLSIGT